MDNWKLSKLIGGLDEIDFQWHSVDLFFVTFLRLMLVKTGGILHESQRVIFNCAQRFLNCLKKLISLIVGHFSRDILKYDRACFNDLLVNPWDYLLLWVWGILKYLSLLLLLFLGLGLGRDVKGQSFFKLDELVDIDSPFSISSAHQNIIELFVILQLLPSLSDNQMPLLAFQVRILRLNNRNHLSSVESISWHEP